MFQANKIAKRFGFFLLVYLSLVFLFQWEPLQKAYNVYYAQVGDRVFNLVNPNYYSDFTEGAPKNDKGWNMTIAIYDRSKHKGRIGNRAYRNRVNPDRLFYRDLYDLALLPAIFLLSLFLITPAMSWKKKLLYFFLSLLILYIFLSFHYSHIFENLIMNNDQVGDNFWAKFVSIFGFRGLTEPLYLIALVSWASFSFRKPLFDWLQDNHEKEVS